VLQSTSVDCNCGRRKLKAPAHQSRVHDYHKLSNPTCHERGVNARPSAAIPLLASPKPSRLFPLIYLTSRQFTMPPPPATSGAGLQDGRPGGCKGSLAEYLVWSLIAMAAACWISTEWVRVRLEKPLVYMNFDVEDPSMVQTANCYGTTWRCSGTGWISLPIHVGAG
jgi:hypothetical protein